MTLPKEFIARERDRLGTGAEEFLCSLDSPSPVSVRFNPFKLSEKPEGRQVPWSRYGFYLDERPQFTLDPLFHGGAYYVQEASSMFVEHLVRESMSIEGFTALDLCASPGGKTTILSTLAGLEGLVVANEVIRQRAVALADNVKKWGLGNVVVTNNDPEHFGAFQDFFDLVLVDAPCSGEGMFRKSPESREQWSENSVALCAARQKRILADVWDSLKPGGMMIYSTCTFNTQENEENVRWIYDNFDCEGVEIPTDDTWGIERGEVNGVQTFRFAPHRTQGEGFFAAVLRKAVRKVKTKTGKARRQIFTDPAKKELQILRQWVGQSEYIYFSKIGENFYGYYQPRFHDVKALAGSMTVIYSGVLAGQLFGTKFKPDHPLALFHDVSREIVPGASLELEAARDYLRKKDIDPGLLCEGLNLVSYAGLPIGWVKRIGNRTNNMYPKELRIMNL